MTYYFECNAKDVQPQLVVRVSCSSSALETNVISRRFTEVADLQISVLNYDEAAGSQIQPFDPHEHLDNMSDEEYRSFIQTAVNCPANHTLPAYSVPTRE